MVTKRTSNFLTLDWVDLGKGLIVAVISPVFTILLTSLNAGQLVFDWKVIGTVAIGAALSYLSKNFFQSSQTIITVKPAEGKETNPINIDTSK